MLTKVVGKTGQMGFDTYRWDGLTEGALLCIHEALRRYDSILARDLAFRLSNQVSKDLAKKMVEFKEAN